MSTADTETFEDGQQSGWTNADGSAVPVDTTPGDGFSNFLGRFGGSGGTEAVSKTYTLMPSQDPTTISFDFNKIDSWDSRYGNDHVDSFMVFLNGEKAIEFTPVSFTGDDDAPGGSSGADGTFTAGALTGSYTITSDGPDTDLGFGYQDGYYHKAFQDRVYHITLKLDSTPSSMTLGFGSTLDQDVDDESYGIDNVAVDPACFCAGTLIATVSGEVPVERLAVGDVLRTADGATRPVKWIGRQNVVARFADPLRAYPICVRAGAIAEGIPTRDLFLSPDHALLIDGVLVQAGALVNDATVTRVLHPETRWTYYHIETQDHAVILAEGTPAETFVTNVTRQRFDNYAEYVALFGDRADFEAMPDRDEPRAMSARQVPPEIRARMAERAVALMLMEPAAA